MDLGLVFKIEEIKGFYRGGKRENLRERRKISVVRV